MFEGGGGGGGPVYFTQQAPALPPLILLLAMHLETISYIIPVILRYLSN